MALVVSWGLAACSGPAAGPREEPSSAPKAASVTSAAVRAESPIDAEGRLKPSGLRIAWFEIPAGFENAASRPQHHAFVSHQVSMTQLRDYLAARMLTGQVDELGEGAIYRSVMPLSAEANAMRFDVQVALVDQGRGVSLTLEERTFLGAPPLSAKEAAKAVAEDQARAE
ncbi:MAG: hypothetical protein QM778_20690 [Myxococcales bacterium]